MRSGWAVFFWLGRDHWGQGIASEALAAFLDDMVPRLGLSGVTAEAFEENAASRAVLGRARFVETGRGRGTAAARPDPAPVRRYRRDG